jgi:peptidoglycan/LPS O-acetylase OafA/YrhL
MPTSPPTAQDSSANPKADSNVNPQTGRLVWIEVLRMLAAIGVLLYHAQMWFSNYAFSPQAIGWSASWQWLQDVKPLTGLGGLSVPIWFGFQAVDFFVLLSGFSLMVSLKGKSLDLVPFWQSRILRLLWPFWTVAWCLYPALWLVGHLTHSYSPDPWHTFSGATFPLTFDYLGTPLLMTSGPWWFMALILSLSVVFPWLWHCLQRWGVRRFLLMSLLVTVLFRLLAVYYFGGHPIYSILTTPALEQPFKLFVSKLSTFAVGMVVGQAYLQGKGPIFWNPVLAWGLEALTYGVGTVLQFYQWGWVVCDLLTPIGLALLGMVLFRPLDRLPFLRPVLLALGRASYTFYLLHDATMGRVILLYIQGDGDRYRLLLPIMVGVTLLLALGIDRLTPWVKRGCLYGLQQLDRRLTLARET